MDILTADTETLQALAEPTITTFGAIITGYFAVRAAKVDRLRPPGRHDMGESTKHLQLMELQVPVIQPPTPSRASWRIKAASQLGGSIAFLALFGYCLVRFFQSEFEDFPWIVAALLFELPGGLFLGAFIFMLQIGMDDAAVYAQHFQVEGDLRLVVERTQDVMHRMKLRIHTVARDEQSATIEASPGDGSRSLKATITSKEGLCSVEVESTMPPSSRSYRRNSGQAIRFIEELVGVHVHPAVWTRPQRNARSPDLESAQTEHVDAPRSALSAKPAPPERGRGWHAGNQ